MPLPSKNVRLPLDIDKKANVIVFKVLLQNRSVKRMINMVFDTGASICTVPSETAIALRCDPSKPKKRIEMITASGIEYVPIIVIPRFTLLGFELKNVETACLNLPSKSSSASLMGLNVIRNFDIFLAFSKKILEISSFS